MVGAKSCRWANKGETGPDLLDLVKREQFELNCWGQNSGCWWLRKEEDVGKKAQPKKTVARWKGLDRCGVWCLPSSWDKTFLASVILQQVAKLPCPLPSGSPWSSQLMQRHMAGKHHVTTSHASESVPTMKNWYYQQLISSGGLQRKFNWPILLKRTFTHTIM